MKCSRQGETGSEEGTLAAEAAYWDSTKSGHLPDGWELAPEFLPRVKLDKMISLRVTCAMITVLKAIAKRRKVGYQTLIKHYVVEGFRRERDNLRSEGK